MAMSNILCTHPPSTPAISSCKVKSYEIRYIEKIFFVCVCVLHEAMDHLNISKFYNKMRIISVILVWYGFIEAQNGNVL